MLHMVDMGVSTNPYGAVGFRYGYKSRCIGHQVTRYAEKQMPIPDVVSPNGKLTFGLE